MVAPTRIATHNADPLIVALAHRKPIGTEVLTQAIAYREAQIDQLVTQIEVLKVRRARLLNEQPS